MRSMAIILMAACTSAGQPSEPAEIVPATLLLPVTHRCQMPVVVPDLARLERMPVDRTNAAVPMPVSRPGCWNPMFHAR